MKNFQQRKRERIAALTSGTAELPKFSFLQLNTNEPLVSVVLPVYNHAKVVASSISSVLRESIPLELIVVDDGSKDDLKSAVQKFLADSRVRFVQKENGGISSALNAGFNLARAPFWTWTSADNYYELGSLSELSWSLLRNSVWPMTYADVRLIDENDRPLKESGYRAQDQYYKDTSILSLPENTESLFSLDDNFINSCFLYRSHIAKLVGEYKAKLLGAEDYEYWLRLCSFLPAGKTHSARPLYNYRLHKESLTGRLDPGSVANKTREIRLQISRNRQSIQSQREISSQTFFPPIELPTQLNRARYSYYQAVPDGGSRPSAGIISNEPLPEVMLKELVENGLQVAVFLLSPRYLENWRELKKRCNFILCEDFPENFGALSESEYRTRSLMFFLSSVDYLCYLGEREYLTSLRFQACLSASAGIALRALRPSIATSPESVSFLPAPHVHFFNSIAEMALEPVEYLFDAETFDSWLQSQSSSHLENMELTALLSGTVN